jgi:hypothetical protein
MRLFSGACPNNCDSANPPGELCEIELPRHAYLPANGAKLMISEPWVGFAHADGVAKSFRVYDYLGEPHIQGSVSKTGDGGDLQLDTDKIHNGQKVVIGAMTLIEIGDMDDEVARRELLRIAWRA